MASLPNYLTRGPDQSSLRHQHSSLLVQPKEAIVRSREREVTVVCGSSSRGRNSIGKIGQGVGADFKVPVMVDRPEDWWRDHLLYCRLRDVGSCQFQVLVIKGKAK
jgi:hypothetical protein